MSSKYTEHGWLVAECTIAGVSHLESPQRPFFYLQKGAEVKVVHEPDNPYDPDAMRIESKEGTKLGYVPKAQSETVHAAFAGEPMKAIITSLDMSDKFPVASVAIYSELHPVQLKIMQHLKAVRQIIKDEICVDCAPSTCMGCMYPTVPDCIDGLALRALSFIDADAKNELHKRSWGRGPWDEDYRMFVNLRAINSAMTRWEMMKEFIPTAHYMVVPMKCQDVSAYAYEGPNEQYKPQWQPNDAFRAVELPREANGFAVFTGCALTFICLCRSHQEALHAVHCVPPFEGHPGKLKLTDDIAWKTISSYLNGVKMFGLEEDCYAYFGHQHGVEGGACFLGRDHKLDLCTIECNSRHFEPARLPPLLS